MVRRATGLHADRTRRQLLKKHQDRASFQLAAYNNLAGAINPMNLKDRLGDIQTDCRDRLHGSRRSVTPSSVAAASLIWINVGSKEGSLFAQSLLRGRRRFCVALFCLCASAKGSEHARELWTG